MLGKNTVWKYTKPSTFKKLWKEQIKKKGTYMDGINIDKSKISD